MTWSGRASVAGALALWSSWLAWRLVTVTGPVGAGVLLVEGLAFTAAVVLSGALWRSSTGRVSSRQRSAARNGQLPLPTTVGMAVGLPDPAVAVAPVGDDDTGEVGWARRGLHVLDPRRSSGQRAPMTEAAWAVAATDGIRRLVFVTVLVTVLLTGRFPFEVRSDLLAVLLASQLLLTIGHFLLSDGLLVPGVRLRWSMASVGAGLGDGTSRSGLPIRWTATLATIVALNLAIALRGVSDRWTHGLGPMAHDERVVAMVTAGWLVAWSFAALRTLPRPELGYYGATRRLEEPSTRRLALGATLTVAAVGLVAGVLPA